MMKLILPKKLFVLFFNLTTIIMLSSCSSNTINEDLEIICDKVTEIQKNNGLSNQEKIHAFAESVQDLELSTNTRKFLNKIFIKSKISFNDFTSFAAKNGIENWSCDALRNLIEDPRKLKK